ncbi:BRCT domain-containing protein [Fusarium falciforme]|uniref:BRCT domain-containing protein n=1 Tax=Fusarium falciforme TaxID=195108 RepID=UPI002300B2FD|nr:BRCT domain-containing protein [Fusarium falciforme]WAO83124.1 BRCT domain-containing protein [Fusarium falciforme]
MESPPKRMTRARAAAKASESKTTKIVTAAARARSTATASTKSTAAKRKTRADEHEEDEEEEHREATVVRRARGRPRKVEAPEPEAPVRATRGRATKKTVTEAPKEEPAAPVRTTRGRPRKVVAAAPEPAPEPVRKTTTRTRVTTTTRAATTTKPAAKKSVKFQEPDKENIEPAIEAKEPAPVGLRGRPAKRGGAASGTRTTRAVVRSAAPTEKKPLSPKKITQMPISRDDDSEDELAGDTTPVKPLMKNPIKPPANAAAKKNPEPVEQEEPAESTTAVDGILNPPDLGTSLVSPAKRRPASPLRDTMRSPARRIGAVPLPGSTVKKAQDGNAQNGEVSSFKASLLQSAAKRPQSPLKGMNLAPTFNAQQSQSAMKPSLLLSPAKRSVPVLKPLTEPRPRDLAALGEPPAMKPLVLGTPTPANHTRTSQKLMLEEESDADLGVAEDDVFSEPIGSLHFPGRLSAVLPRHADPAMKKEMGIVDEVEEAPTPAEEDATEVDAIVVDQEEAAAETEPVAEPTGEADEMAIDDEAAEEEHVSQATTPNGSPAAQSPAQQNPSFQLREKDLDPCQDIDSESDDENIPPKRAEPATPTPFNRKTPKSSRASLGGFTSLVDRLGSWSASTPIKMAPLTSAKATGSNEPVALPERTATPRSESSPAVNHFFEDEMTVREGMENIQQDKLDEVQEPEFDDIMVTEEDVALALEANEMSLMGPEELDEVVNTDAFDDTLSEASQEYGDENELPVDPAMTPRSAAPVTPVRPVMKTFHTTTKVPLKPADLSTPTPLKKRSFTASRVAPKRPSGSTSNTIPYSQSRNRKSLPATFVQSPSAPSTPVPATPSRADLWSSMGTPARTPRRDVDPALLRGAVVFVDVYTSEGADASSIFVELLTQMGAKCIKTWNWNPSGSASDVTSSKVGITHVVFKDGSKRTLEKVRESNGIVQCVGVSWVLDCERENEWLDESPYHINTRNVPRGGARRRKSMEPTALANMNGTLVSSPSKSSPRTAPTTPIRRRESTAWMYTPSEADEDEDMEDHEWSAAILTPVPKTPAPEAIARYAANLGPETPSAGDDEEDFDDSPTKTDLLTRTCPPKSNAFREAGAGIISQNKDDHVLMRLMAARRKSLQFAPKVGSPLARAWK